MSEYIPFILFGAGVLVSVFGFFIKQEMGNLRRELDEIKKDLSEVKKQVHESEKREQRLSSDMSHAIETMHDIKEIVLEKL